MVIDHPFHEISAFAALPRLTGIALSIDGTRLVATVAEPDGKGAKYTSAIWDVTPGTSPSRLTRADQGEASPAFLPDGSLLFVSARPDPAGEEDEPALWLLPPAGEPTVVAHSPGGVAGPVVATDSGTVIVAGSRLIGSVDAEDDRVRRATRKDRKVNAILHTGMPVRHWDRELGDVSPRLLHLDRVGLDGELRDLTPDAGASLTEAAYSVSADGRMLATTWRQRRSRGRFPSGLCLLDVPAGTRSVLVDEGPDIQFESPAISPDGQRVAVTRTDEGDFDTPFKIVGQVRSATDGAHLVDLELGDLFPTELVWSRDSRMLFVAGDAHGRAPVLAVDPDTGQVLRRLAGDAAYANLCPSPDGRYLYALRSAPDAAPAPVRLDTSLHEQEPEYLPTPAPAPQLPGRLTEVDVQCAGATVRGWLCLPADGAPAPLMMWVHGGPFLSSNSWSWRWNPWVAVARGYAVLLPDPALSTGYGPDFIARAWPHRAAQVWRDLEALLDAVVARPDIDGTRTACLGGSFGGYMTNWIAGHTDRFAAIVTHAGLWALDQQHTTTDGAAWKSNLFGTPADHPEWYAENSPHNFADRIRTPMLVVHGNRDYRVPISEALRLWWDLVSRFTGEPDDLPHRFLQLTGENHWVLSPANVELWYETVLDFCAQHVRPQAEASAASGAGR